jgi:acetyl/propionyl-CoA carboxylase alpha subunit
MAEAIAATRLQGVPNNLEFLGHIVKDPRFIAGAAQQAEVWPERTSGS